jgi:hypothetical protein
MARGRRSRVRSNRALSPSLPNARYRDNAALGDPVFPGDSAGASLKLSRRISIRPRYISRTTGTASFLVDRSSWKTMFEPFRKPISTAAR